MTLKAGMQAPNFVLPDHHRVDRTLAEFLGKWVILFFYPKDNTPACTEEACGFSELRVKNLDTRVEVWGISPDSATRHQNFIKKFDLKIGLLTDSEHSVSDLYGVWGLKTLFGRQYMGVIRTTFLIDPEGKIAEIWPGVSVKGHVEAVWESLKLKQTQRSQV